MAHISGRGSRRARVVGVVVVSVFAVACQTATQTDQLPSTNGGANNTPTASQARLSIAPATHSRKVDPSAGISVKVARGVITNVTAQADGQAVAGEKGASGTSWHSRWALLTNSRRRPAI